jgi:hypothetical protein
MCLTVTKSIYLVGFVRCTIAVGIRGKRNLMGGRTSVKVSVETILASAKWCGDYGKPEFCNVPGCARTPVTMSLCKAHYHYWQRYRTVTKRTSPDYASVLPYVQPPTKGHRLTTLQHKCHMPKCVGRYEARGLCKQHYGWFIKWRNLERAKNE